MSRKRRISKVKLIRLMPVLFVIAALFLVVLFKGYDMKKKNIAYASRISELEAEKAAEEKRTADIEKYRAYVKTDEYKREVLREKFNYADKNEIVFRFVQ